MADLRPETCDVVGSIVQECFCSEAKHDEISAFAARRSPSSFSMTKPLVPRLPDLQKLARIFDDSAHPVRQFEEARRSSNACPLRHTISVVEHFQVDDDDDSDSEFEMVEHFHVDDAGADATKGSEADDGESTDDERGVHGHYQRFPDQGSPSSYGCSARDSGCTSEAEDIGGSLPSFAGTQLAAVAKALEASTTLAAFIDDAKHRGCDEVAGAVPADLYEQDSGSPMPKAMAEKQFNEKEEDSPPLKTASKLSQESSGTHRAHAASQLASIFSALEVTLAAQKSQRPEQEQQLKQDKREEQESWLYGACKSSSIYEACRSSFFYTWRQISPPAPTIVLDGSCLCIGECVCHEFLESSGTQQCLGGCLEGSMSWIATR